MRKVVISVIGAGKATAAQKAIAHAVGAEIARRGAVLLCGGLGGVMEAACAGAASCGGITVGYLPGTDASQAAESLQIALPTGLGEARNYLVATGGDAVVAVGGSLGTLSELAFALKKRLPVAAIGSWKLGQSELPADAVLYEATSAADAVEFVFSRIERE